MANESDLLFSIDGRALRKSLQATARRFDATQKQLMRAIDIAVVKYAEDTLREAQERAPVGKSAGRDSSGKFTAKGGGLRASGTIDGPNQIGDGIEVLIGFDKVYARIQDLGGTIFPVRAKRLFVPLREGVHPLKPGDPRRKDQKSGVDFVLARSVTLPGSRYLTGLLPERTARAPEAISTTVIEILRKSLGERRAGGGPGRDPVTGRFV